MKFFSLKVLFLCIFLPPVLYIFTIQATEEYLQSKYLNKIEDIYIGDAKPLLEGTQSIEETIEQNIQDFLTSKKWFQWAGGEIDVLIKTNTNQIIYPSVYLADRNKNNGPPKDTIKIARENFEILNEGLQVKLNLKISHNTKLSNAVFSDR